MDLPQPISTLQRPQSVRKELPGLCNVHLPPLCCIALFTMPPLSHSTVILKIDQVAFIDYRLVRAPQVTSKGLDTSFKVRGCGKRALELRPGRKPAPPSRVSACPPSPLHLPLHPHPGPGPTVDRVALSTAGQNLKQGL